MWRRVQVAVGRRAARAILVDGDGHLVLIKRTKPGRDPYWTKPGGGVESTDVSVEATLHRELAEDLGAEATSATQVFVFSSPSDNGISVQHFSIARLTSRRGAGRSSMSRLGAAAGSARTLADQ
jgi:ADP-ribose pyrophosphatase YjhB (NUDIX family)